MLISEVCAYKYTTCIYIQVMESLYKPVDEVQIAYYKLHAS